MINTIVTAAYAVGAAWRGYVRRREFWTRGSWIGLGVVILVGLSLLAGSIAISIAIDHHEPWAGAPHSSTRSQWVLVIMSSMMTGIGLIAGLLAWFAMGDPERQFPFLGSFAGTRRPAPADLAEEIDRRTSAPSA